MQKMHTIGKTTTNLSRDSPYKQIQGDKRRSRPTLYAENAQKQKNGNTDKLEEGKPDNGPASGSPVESPAGESRSTSLPETRTKRPEGLYAENAQRL